MFAEIYTHAWLTFFELRMDIAHKSSLVSNITSEFPQGEKTARKLPLAWCMHVRTQQGFSLTQIWNSSGGKI